MKQYGGSIPFHILGRVTSKSTKPKTKPKTKQTRKHKRSRQTKQKSRFRLYTNKYKPGTILRENGTLFKLTTKKKWRAL